MANVQNNKDALFQTLLEYSTALDNKNKPLTTNQITKILRNEYSVLIQDFNPLLFPDLIKQIRKNKNHLDIHINWDDTETLIQNGIKDQWINALHQQSEWVLQTFNHSFNVPALVANKTCLYFNKTTYEEALSWQYILDNGGIEIDKPVDVFVLGSKFYLRKLFAKLYDKKPVITDLEQHLQLKPWESNSKEQIYIEQLQKSKIEPLVQYEDFLKNKLGTKSSIVYKLGSLISGKEYLLPSEQINILNRQNNHRFKLVLPTASNTINHEIEF